MANQSTPTADERRKFVNAWRTTMITIWRERLARMRVIRTGALYNSILNTRFSSNQDMTSFTVKHAFREYGIWVDLGVGREVPRGNPGDIGREKKRQRKKWFSTKYYASVMNLREYLAESIGREFVGLISNGLNPSRLGRRRKRNNPSQTTLF